MNQLDRVIFQESQLIITEHFYLYKLAPNNINFLFFSSLHQVKILADSVSRHVHPVVFHFVVRFDGPRSRELPVIQVPNK